MTKSALTALMFCIGACLLSLYLGQDASFDLKNYHIYNAWAVLNDRWAYDVLGSGNSTFFCPFGDVPYYLLASTLLPSHGVLLVALAGIPYGMLVHLLYLISRRIAWILPFDTARDRALFIAASVVLAGTGAVTCALIGVTSNDVVVAMIVVAGFHQILCALRDNGQESISSTRVGVAGALLGLAMGVKLTAAIHVPALALVILCIAPGWRNKIRNLIVYGGCALVIFAIVYGPWAWTLYQLTGNPFFPMFNGIFHSDWISSINVRDVHFLPKSWLQWFFYPFYWTTSQWEMVTEVPFRDVRLALAYVFVAGYLAVVLVSADLRAKLFSGRYKAINALVLFIVSSYVLWLFEFSILRYLVAVECLAGVFIAVSLMVLAWKLRYVPMYLPSIFAILVVGFIVAYTAYPNWGRVPAGTDILAVQTPRFDNGSLIIFADVPMSFLAPGLAAGGEGLRFMTISREFHSRQLGADAFTHELGRRMQNQVRRNRASIYVVFRKSDAPPESGMADFDVHIDMSNCQTGHSSLEPEFLACKGIYREARTGG